MPAPSTTSEPGWRSVVEVHSAAELFPPMAQDELRQLGEDIAKNGLQSPVVLLQPEDGGAPVLLDGRSRLDAMQAVGMPVVDADGKLLVAHEIIDSRDGFNPLAYVDSANLHRRHLTPEQRRDRIAELLKADPTKSDRSIAKMVRRDHKTVGAVRLEKEARGEIPHTETRTDSAGRQQPAMRRRAAASAPAEQVIPITVVVDESEPARISLVPTGPSVEQQAASPVLNNAELRAMALKQARRDFEAWESRYSYLKELVPILAAANSKPGTVSSALRADPEKTLRGLIRCVADEKEAIAKKMSRADRLELAGVFAFALSIRPTDLSRFRFGEAALRRVLRDKHEAGSAQEETLR